jgi:hypothetical protein
MAVSIGLESEDTAFHEHGDAGAHRVAITALAARLEPDELRSVIAALERHPGQHAAGWENYEDAAGLITTQLARR